MLCAALKNKKSTERCSAKALKNLSFCGKHAKAKNPKLWTSDKSESAVLIQKIWRGWRIRNYFKMAGPGVLKRSLCNNLDDIVTFDRIHPMNYFAFTEDGKVHCFDFRSIFQICITKLNPENPYTRQAIDTNERKRLKEFGILRERRLLPLFHDPLYMTDRDKVFALRWMTVSQMIGENLFTDIEPIYLYGLNRNQMWHFTQALRTNFLLWAKEHNSLESRRNSYYLWIHSCLRRQAYEQISAKDVAIFLGGCLSKILKDCKKPDEVCFRILGALHSL